MSYACAAFQIAAESNLAPHRVADLRTRIAELKETLKGGLVEAAAINAQQELLEQPVENYTNGVNASLEALEPFDALWTTVGEYLETSGRWYRYVI